MISHIPIPNPYRVYDNKEIDLVSLLPNYMKGGEVQTFVELFEKYLNEMYIGTGKYIPPEQLEIIPYNSEIIWTNDYEYITAPYGNFLKYFQAGDYVKKNGDDVYYKIESVIDDSTIKLVEKFKNNHPSYLKCAYWENFSTNEFTSFWKGIDNGISPVGMEPSFMRNYRIDSLQSRVYYDDGGADRIADVEKSTLATQLVGETEFEVGFQRSIISNYRNNKFGLEFESGVITYRVYYENGFLKLYVGGGSQPTISGHIELTDTEDNWVVNITRKRATNKVKVKVSSLKPKAGSTPLLFTMTTGFFNRLEYEFDIPTEDVFNNNVTLKILNGWRQGWDYFYFQAESGLPGEVDNITLTNNSIELPSVNSVRINPFGRAFNTDGGSAIYQFYLLNGQLKIRDVEDTLILGASEFRRGNNHISILEKIRRLTELHDPDLIDMEYIQYFARYMGYSVNINRDTLSSFYNQSGMNNEERQNTMDNYLRSVMGNLPHWYKIKSTSNAIAIMLYSFGLVTDIRNFYCTDYTNRDSWLSFAEKSTEKVGLTDKHFITPHFGVRFDVDGGVADEARIANSMVAIVDAINSVRPINTVFEGLEAYFKRNMNGITIQSYGYINHYDYLK